MNRSTTLHQAQPSSLTKLTHLAGNLRRTVTAHLMREFGVRLSPPLLRRVVEDAVEVAEETGFPNLFFPALAEEKARFVSAALNENPFTSRSQSLQNAA